MRTIACIRRIFGIALVLLILISSISLLVFAETPNSNRFNVMFVLDASGSMKDSDPEGLRFEAISQFTNLLASHGNYLGEIVFSTRVLSEEKPLSINSQEDKNSIVRKLTDVEPSGWTNTGDALMSAVDDLIKAGDPKLPSVIVFLSDGNTTLGEQEATDASLDVKADAIQKAREQGIAIYTICLNADSSADISEMKQISDATGGEFREVKKPEDLGDVFNTFYNLIYGTSTIPLVDDIFPDNGIVEKTFDVPGIGVEEVNIIIYGKTSTLKLFKPDLTESDTATTLLRSLTMIKITDVIPGTWKIVTTGVPGDKIKINMVYNSNLDVSISVEPPDSTVAQGTDISVAATLRAGNQSATSSEQYNGYNAKLLVLDAYENELDSIPMSVVGDRFEASPSLNVGTYKFKVFVSGSYTEKESELYGPLEIIPPEERVEEHINTPPQPVNNPVKKSVNIWPFVDNSLEINMSDLAFDKEDSTLRYKILSSSFIEGADYSVSNDVIKLEHFSLSKGAFTIRATDSGGLNCDIEVVITSHNIGLIALILLGVLAVLVAIGIGISLYIAFTRPFRGTITAQSYYNGTYKGVPRAKRRGRMKLSVFGMDPTGLDYNKSYFQATGSNFVYLVTNKPVIWNGRKEKKIRIQGGSDVVITVDEANMKRIHIRFDSRIKGAGKKPPKKPSHK